MATTVASYGDVAKEVWDSDSLEKQFYDENPWLDTIEKRQRVTIGGVAKVPLHLDRAGGTTILDNAGGNINAAGAEHVGHGEFRLTYNYFPVQIEVGAVNELTGGASSVGEALENMITSGLNNLRNQVTRQFLSGHGHVLQLAANTAVNTLALSTLASVGAGEISGADALASGWLVPDDVIDIGTAADGDTVAAARKIIDYDDNPAAPTITIDGAAVTTTTSNFVYLKGAQAGSTSTLKESGGMVTFAGQSSNVVGGVDPADEPKWKPAMVDSSTTTIDMDLLLTLTRKVRRVGGNGAFLLTSLLQLDNVYQLLQQQVRFSGDRELGAGGSEQVRWRGNVFHAFPQVPENFLFLASEKLQEFEIVLGKFTKPTWMSDIMGANRAGVWNPGTTHFDDTVMYALGLAVRRRNTLAAATHLQ